MEVGDFSLLILGISILLTNPNGKSVNTFGHYTINQTTTQADIYQPYLFIFNPYMSSSHEPALELRSFLGWVGNVLKAVIAPLNDSSANVITRVDSPTTAISTPKMALTFSYTDPCVDIDGSHVETDLPVTTGDTVKIDDKIYTANVGTNKSPTQIPIALLCVHTALLARFFGTSQFSARLLQDNQDPLSGVHLTGSLSLGTPPLKKGHSVVWKESKDVLLYLYQNTCRETADAQRTVTVGGEQYGVSYRLSIRPTLEPPCIEINNRTIRLVGPKSWNPIRDGNFQHRADSTGDHCEFQMDQTLGEFDGIFLEKEVISTTSARQTESVLKDNGPCCVSVTMSLTATYQRLSS
ncbi:hypothetical protein M231_00001 [Tremella mesenterica]|uniref:Uncharacterized protein n=1 Tax=Tremella mesenterica TaxID=5217 RepID=A0A4V1M531_TREME|nr:hypothetical protein M231_00001 [Tremella mesenterica]